MKANEEYTRDLRSQRDELLTAYAAVDSCPALFDFQLQLAAAIESHEPAAFASRDAEAKEQLRLLRLLGDGLAWRLLHPHAIRQLAKNPAPPPALGIQGNSGFSHTLDAARRLAVGCPVLVCDLTHCLTIGDLVVCDDPERPSIIECGGHPMFLKKGRKARQRERAQAVVDLLKTGTAVFPGNDVATETFEVDVPLRHTWAVVDRLVQAAEKNGVAAELASDDELVFALRADTDPRAGEMHDLTAHMAEPTSALYTRTLERPDPRVPPCVAWEVSLATKRLVYQGDVFVGHVIDSAAFIGCRRGSAEIVKILRTGDVVTGFGVMVGNEPATFSHEFLTDVLLGFETIQSKAEYMLEAAEKFAGLADAIGPEHDTPHACRRYAELADENGFLNPVVAWGELAHTRP